MTATQPSAPAEHPAAGAGLPAHVYDALHALADAWDVDLTAFEDQARDWREQGNALLEGTATGRVRQLADNATALRNLANDLAKETACNPE